MGLFNLGATFAFNSVAGVFGLREVTRGAMAAGRQVGAMQLQAKAAGLTLQEFNQTLYLAKTPTGFQKNVALMNRTVRTFTSFVTEARKVYNDFIRGTKRVPTWLGGQGYGSKKPGRRSAVSGLVGPAAGESLSRGIFETANNMVHAGLTGLEAGMMLGHREVIPGGFREWVQGSIEAATQHENSLVTFNAMLGSTEKTEQLLKRINRYAALTPYTLEDTIGAARNLLTVSTDNLDANERLFKMAGNMAALRPGQTMELAAQAITSASVGEFDPLKKFGIIARAEQFKQYGKPGGKAYVEAVVTEIENQFTRKTGGRDLVGMLGTTLTGRLSTFEGVVSQIKMALGEQLIKQFQLKEMLGIVMPVTSQFYDALEYAFTGKMEHMDWTNFPVIITLAESLKFLVDQLKPISNFVMNFSALVYRTFEGMSAGARKVVVAVTAVITSLSGGMGLTGAFLSVLAPVAMLASLFTSIFGSGMLSTAVVALGTISSLFIPVTLSLSGLAAAFAALFAAFRNDGESIGDTLKRGLIGSINALLYVLQGSYYFIKAFWSLVSPAFTAGFAVISESFGPLKEHIRGFFTWLGEGESMLTLRNFALAGVAFGRMVANVVYGISKAVAMGISGMGTLLGILTPAFKRLGSDIKGVLYGLRDFITGVDRSTASLKQIFAGWFDIFTSPFREALGTLFEMSATAFKALAEKIEPYSTFLSNQALAVSTGMQETAHSIREGLLATKKYYADGGPPVEVRWKIEDLFADIKFEATLDGQKVSEGIAKADMRSKNASRPVSPDELGFLLEGNGRNIRTVNPDAIYDGDL